MSSSCLGDAEGEAATTTRDTDICLRTCDDGVCNGVESCSPSHPSADGDGCIDGAVPCTVGCNEAAGSCETCEVPDTDGDGVASITCGGNDCDDANPDRYPGNVELCDDIDQDCDPSTLGPDRDGDSFVDTHCCNPTDEGEVCGGDCDDTRAGVNPSAVDGCGGGDEDCDGTIDEKPDSTFYRDRDFDTYGDPSDTFMACAQPEGYAAVPGDCLDDPSDNPFASQINPGRREICDGLDNNCSMVIDDHIDLDGAPLPCGCDTPGLCDFGKCQERGVCCGGVFCGGDCFLSTCCP